MEKALHNWKAIGQESHLFAFDGLNSTVHVKRRAEEILEFSALLLRYHLRRDFRYFQVRSAVHKSLLLCDQQIAVFWLFGFSLLRN